MADAYDKGDVLRVTGTYRDSAGTLIDPAVVKFSVKTPSGVMTTYTYPDPAVVKSSTGVYYSDVRLTEPSRMHNWVVRHWSTGAGEASAEKEYYVRVGAF